jgi:hypothetical protein
MKSVLFTLLIVVATAIPTLPGAGSQTLGEQTLGPPPAPSVAIAPRPRPARRLHGLRIRRQAYVATTTPEGRSQAFVIQPSDAQADTSGQPGWILIPDRAGWGKTSRDTQTTLGAYRLPDRPDIPPPQMNDQNNQGAAGLSVTLNLGR